MSEINYVVNPAAEPRKEQDPQSVSVVQTDPNVLMVTSMIDNIGRALVQGMTEPERIKAAEGRKRAQIQSEISKLTLWIAAGLSALMLTLGACAFFIRGEHQLLGQAFSFVVGILGGVGIGKVAGRKE